MATIFNPKREGESGGSSKLIIGAVGAIVIISLFFLYGLPAMRKNESNSGITTVTVPDKAQVGVNK